MDVVKRGLITLLVIFVVVSLAFSASFTSVTDLVPFFGKVTGIGLLDVTNAAPYSLTIPDQTILLNGNLTINLSQYFFDPENVPLNFTSTFPLNVTVVITEGNPIVLLIPDANFSGITNITFSAFDLVHTNSSNLVTLAIGLNAGWINVTAPEGVFEPPNSTIVGTHVDQFGLRFTGLTVAPTQDLACNIKTADGTFVQTSQTGLSLQNESYRLPYNVTLADSIILDLTSHFLPWIVKNCTLKEGSTTLYSQDLNQRIYTHDPVYWVDDEITRAVTCQGTPGVYFNNTAKCEFTEDTLFALQMRNGNPVNVSCFDNVNVACEDDLCKGIHFPSCDPLSYFGGFSADTEDPNNYATFTASFASYNTPVAYTYATNTSGSFKLRITQALTNKAFSFTIYNLTNVSSSGTNVYGSNTGSGTVSVTDQGDGTYTVAYYNFGLFTGTLDFTMNVSFTDPALEQNRSLQLVIAYGTETNQGTPPSFNVTFDPDVGLTNANENETSSWTTDVGGVCGDEANNDFDYIGGTWADGYDCFDYDCNLVQGDESQTNEFGSANTGLCNYNFETNCSDAFDNDYDYVAGTDFTDCHDTECFQNNTHCPATELICDDGINNDWDYTLGNTDLSSSQKVENNGTKYDWTYQSNLTDCEDGDCDGQAGGSSGQLCNWGYETNCSDGFDNDALQLLDCQLSAVGSSIETITPAYGEYDCSQYCRDTNTSTEVGSLCDDNVDNDYDAVVITGFYSNEYTSNTTYGAGTDCRWGGYFGIGSNYNPDEDCNATIMSLGFECQLAHELNCTDSFDNDFDEDADGMPNANWSINVTDYLLYFGTTYSTDADYDDYDCAATSPPNESLNAYWCFDGIDNDLDAYYFNSTTYIANASTGYDCGDPDCLGVQNPQNPNQTCLDYEYNATDPFFTNLSFPGLYCANSLDDDSDGPIDCADLDCFKQFDMCSQGPCYSSENLTWTSCADSSDNDYADGTDCADTTDCVGLLGDTSGPLCQGTETSCSDSFDNDADSSTDCADSDCDGEEGDIIDTVSVLCSSVESTLTECYDGFDNDADVVIDCMDPGCNSVCDLASISGTSPITLPVVSGPTSLNSVSTATIPAHTTQIRNGETYNITLQMIGVSTDAQWTLGTATGGTFQKSSFNTATATLYGPSAGNFSLTETVNGFIIDSNAASLPSGYTVSFSITSTSILSAINYEITYVEASGFQTSLNNFVSHKVNENVVPIANRIQVVPNNSKVDYGSSVSMRANISDDNALGLCDWLVTGVESFNPSDSTVCTGSFTPTVEGSFTINVTPLDYYSNRGSSLTQSYIANLLPTGNTTTTNKRFYNASAETLTFNATFNVPSSDVLGTCTLYAENDSAQVSLTSFAATGNTCYKSDVSLVNLDGVYTFYATVMESTDSNTVTSNTNSVFVCSQFSEGPCVYADFDSNNEGDICGLVFAPTIVFVAPTPADGSSQTSTTVTINTTVSDNVEVDSCFITFNGVNYSMTKIGSGTEVVCNYTATSLGLNTYTYKVYANDTEGNIGQSEQRTFTVAAVTTPEEPSGGGGGGGGWSERPINETMEEEKAGPYRAPFVEERCIKKAFFIDDELQAVNKNDVLLISLHECNTFYFGESQNLEKKQIEYLVIDEISLENNIMFFEYFDLIGYNRDIGMVPLDIVYFDVDHDGLDDYYVRFDSFESELQVNVEFGRVKKTTFFVARKILSGKFMFIWLLPFFLLLLLLLFYLYYRRKNRSY